MRRKFNIIFLTVMACMGFTLVKHKPVLYIIGDSTVKNGDGTGRNGQVGWGTVIDVYFDTSEISIQNDAIGGRSSRTFVTDGRWIKILANLQKGDYVIMQFGHNDAGALDDTARARGTIKGIGNDSIEIFNPIRKTKEIVHSYGWYMRKYVSETKARGATAIICSPIPRNDWKNGMIVRNNQSYGLWAQQVAAQQGAFFIDLNEMVASAYERMDSMKVRSFFPADNTHTNREGAVLNATMVARGIKGLSKCKLKEYLNKDPEIAKPVNKKKILAALELTNGYFMKKWPDPGKPIVTNKERPSNIWTRSVYYEGLMSLYKIDKKKKYYQYAVNWGTRHQWGLNDGVETRNADNQCSGQTYLDLYLLDNKNHPEWIRDIKASVDKMKATDKLDDWNWIDALQMGMPVFVKLGNIYKDSSYFNRMYELYAYTKFKQGDSGLYNAQEKLWYRDKDFIPPYKEPNGQDCFWSRGNGWVVAALVRTLQALPTPDPHYKEYLQDYRNMMAALLLVQREDGCWNPSLHDPTHFAGKELTGTSLFIYGMAWGVNQNILDRTIYLPVLLKAWNTLAKDCIHPDGRLGYVQGTGKEPKDGQPVSFDNIPDFEDYGLGCFLLAGSEVFKLTKGK